MKASKNKIKQCLIRAGYSDSDYNIMIIEDGLQWEYREDYSSMDDTILAVIEDTPNLAVVSV